MSERLAATVSDELREARVARGLSQTQVASAIGVRRVRISAVERRVTKAMTVDQLARQAAVLGLRLVIKLYPVGTPIRDAAQIKYTSRFLSRIGSGWTVRLDAPVPLAGDLRAIDIVLDGACVVSIEIITRVRDIQAELRAAQLKQRDFGAHRLFLVLAGTHANRRALAAARIALAAAFDLDSRRVLGALAAGQDPGRDAVIVLD